MSQTWSPKGHTNNTKEMASTSLNVDKHANAFYFLKVCMLIITLCELTVLGTLSFVNKISREILLINQIVSIGVQSVLIYTMT